MIKLKKKKNCRNCGFKKNLHGPGLGVGGVGRVGEEAEATIVTIESSQSNWPFKFFCLLVFFVFFCLNKFHLKK